MRRRRLRRCLAVSTVIGNMLMILITLSLAAILIAWAGSSFGAFSGGSGIFFVQRQQAMEERFVIEVVNFTKSQNFIDVFVRNVGVEQINVVAIYANGTAYTPTGNRGCTLLNAQPLAIGSVCDFNIVYTPGWSTGNIFNIVVASGRGNQVTYTVRGP